MPFLKTIKLFYEGRPLRVHFCVSPAISPAYRIHLSVGSGRSYPQSSSDPDTTRSKPFFKSTFAEAVFSGRVLAVMISMSVVSKVTVPWKQKLSSRKCTDNKKKRSAEVPLCWPFSVKRI